MGCRQVFMSHATDGVTAGNPANYSSPTCAQDPILTWVTTSLPAQVWLTDAVVKYLKIRVPAGPGVGKSWSVTLEADGSDVGTATITDTNTTGFVVLNTNLFGKLVRLRRNSTGAPTVTDMWVTFVTDGVNPGESYYGGYLSAGGTLVWSPLSGDTTDGTQNQGNVFAAAGSITAYSIRSNTAPASGKSYVMTIYKNGIAQDGTGGTVDTRLTVDDTFTGQLDWLGSLPCPAGTRIYFKAVEVGGPADMTFAMSMVFVATNDGESNVGFTCNANMTTSSGTFFAPIRADVGWQTTEADVAYYNDSPYSFVLKGLWAKMNGAPTNPVTFSLRQNGSDPSGGPSTTMTSPQNSSNDPTNSFTVAADDVINFQAVQSGNVGIARVGSCSSIMYALSDEPLPPDSDDDPRVTIAGVDYIDDILGEDSPGIDVSFSLNDRSSCVFYLRPDATEPDQFSEVVCYKRNGITPIYGGIVMNVETVEVENASKKYFPKVTCADFFTYFDWTTVSLSYDAPVTLITVLEDIVAQLPVGYGIVLSSSQETGDTLDPFSKVNVKLSDLIRDLSNVTGWVARISPLKAFRMLAPSSEAAPLSVSNATPNCTDFQWKYSDRVPANTVLLSIGPDTPTNIMQTWAATAGELTFVTDFPATNLEAFTVATVTGPLITEPRYCTVGLATDAVQSMFNWDQATNTLSVSTYDDIFGSFDGTETVTLWYTAAFPYTIVKTTGASPEIQFTARDATITELAAGEARAQGLLDQLSTRLRLATMVTVEDELWRVGQALDVTLTTRKLSSVSFTITSVKIHMDSKRYWQYTLELQENDVYQGNYLDRWKDLLGSGSSASSGLSITSSGTSSAGFSTVVRGGTGRTSLDNHELIVGRDADPPASLGVGTAGQYLRSGGAGADPAFASIAETEINFTDNTTNNVSTTKHGYAPKLPNDATKYLDGTGAFSVPGGGGGGGSNGDDFLAAGLAAGL